MMDSTSTVSLSSPTLGDIPVGIFYGQENRVEELNQRLYDRTLPANIPMEVCYDPRPVSTKYVVFPAWTEMPVVNTPIREVPLFSTENQFYSGDRMAPPSGFRTHITTESKLMNLDNRIIRGGTVSPYVPNYQTSDMYHIRVAKSSTSDPLAPSHPYLERNNGASKWITSGQRHYEQRVIEEKKDNWFYNNTRN